ncbi:MAG: zinc ABC transporter substrate-binding protein, partial [Pseudomonadota bacterium]
MKRFFFIIFSLFLAASCSSFDRGSDKKISVMVSIEPQAYFLKRIGGDLVDVGVLIGSGQSPHTYEPTPRQLAKLSDAKIFFTIGLPFERELTKKISAQMGLLRIIDTSAGIKKRGMNDHSHHGEMQDPHVWLDPVLVAVQASTIARELIVLDPKHEAFYIGNLSKFIDDINTVTNEIATELSPYQGKEFYVFHPSFGYFADRFGLKEVAIEIEGKEPSLKQLIESIDEAKKSGAKVIFVEPQFSEKSAKVIASEIDGRVETLDPLAKDYLMNLKEI